MKILQLVQKRQRRGAEIFAYQLSEELVRQNHTVHTLYLYPYLSEPKLPLRSMDAELGGNEHHKFETLFGLHPRLLQKICQKIWSFRPDVVQVNGARSVKYGALAKRISKSSDWALVYRNIDNPAYWVTDPFRRLYYSRLVMPAIDGVIGVSEATLQIVQEMYHLNTQMRFIPNGISTDHLMVTGTDSLPLSENHAGPILLFMGNLSQQKRPDRFLRVAAEVSKAIDSLRIYILGDGPQRKALEAQAKELNISHKVHFWGYQQAIAPFLASASLLLVTSDSDGIPAVVLEAGYLGVPTVASNVGGMAECIRDGETGLLVDPNDESQIAKVVTDLLRDEKRRIKMAESARTWVSNRFTMQRVAGEYLDFYHQVLNSLTPVVETYR